MKILLVTGYFPPDTGSAANLFYELGGTLVKKGHTVSVLTSFPSYHVTGAAKTYTGSFVDEQVEGMRVHRVRVPQFPRSVPAMRALWQFSMAYYFTRAIKRMERHDVVLVYSPPLPLGFVGAAAQRQMGARFILNVQDLFPRSAIDLGVLKNRFLIRFFERLERRIYLGANHITVHSQGNMDHVVGVGVPARNATVLPNWIDTEFIRPDGSRRNRFAERYNLNGEFIVSFAGVLGYSQDIDVVLEAAKRLQPGPAVRFLIVGDGAEKERLQRKAEALQLDRVTFLPMQPREVYPFVLHCSDVCLSTLNKEVVSPVVPSKILSIMAAGKPVVACMNLAGDAPKIIHEAGCGFVFSAGDDESLAQSILKLQASPPLCHTLGENGRHYCETHFSLNACSDKYVELFSKL